jgi:voltage-gated sodium channel
LVTEKINHMFSTIFIIEALIKLAAFKWRYFRDSWNIFDLFIITISLCFIIVKELLNLNVGSTTQAVRTLRLGRMLKLFRSMK